MPTQQTTYNSRITDEALEKRFRDTFRSQGGAELVDDLYASGVIVPVVDFTQAAEGSQLPQNLQTAWDFSTGHNTVENTTATIVSTPGFWQVDLNISNYWNPDARELKLSITDGLTSKVIWELNIFSIPVNANTTTVSDKLVVFLRSGDSLVASSNRTLAIIDVWYRQIADISGNLINPTGFTSS